MESELRLDLVIEGRVQSWALPILQKSKPNHCALREVKNISDGKVFLTAQGQKESIENFLRWCRQKVLQALLSERLKKSMEKQKNFSEFRILY